MTNKPHDADENTSSSPNDNLFSESAYIDIVFSAQRKPKTNYPAKLAEYLKNSWYSDAGSLLDIGCGRDDMLKAFSGAGYDVSGVDLSPSSIDACKPHPVNIVNLETEKLPFDNQSFDFTFSKSVIEHLRQPLHYL